MISAKWKWRIALIVVLVVFAAFWGATFAYHRIAKARYESYIAELAAKGESLEVDDLRPPSIENPEDDVAKAPVFAEFLERCRADPDAEWEEDPVWGVLDLEKIEGSSKKNFTSNGKMVRYISAVPLSSHFDSVDEMDAARRILEYGDSHSSLFAGIREALARPEADFHVVYEDLLAPLPGLNGCVGLSAFLDRQGRAALLLDRSDLAKENVVTLLHLSRHVRKQRLLIHGLVAHAAHGFALSVIREGLADRRWSESDLDFFSTELERQEIEESLLASIRVERAMAMDIFGRARYDRELWKQPMEVFHREWIYWFPELRKGLCYDNMEFCSRFIQENVLEDVAGRKLSNNINVPIRKYAPPTPTGIGWFDRIRDSVRTFRYESAETSFNVHDHVQITFLQSKVYNDLARIAVSIELHRLHLGNIPSTLEIVTLANGDPLPLDPITGANYVYRVEAQGDYVLYSPGPNGVDEGGMIRLDREDGDWGWRLRLPADFDYDAYRGG